MDGFYVLIFKSEEDRTKFFLEPRVQKLNIQEKHMGTDFSCVIDVDEQSFETVRLVLDGYDVDVRSSCKTEGLKACIEERERTGTPSDFCQYFESHQMYIDKLQ